jgi:hypothetical protein
LSKTSFTEFVFGELTELENERVLYALHFLIRV